MRINQYVDLNLSASVMPPVLHMAQGDGNSRNIVATLWNGTSGFTIPSDAAVMLRFGKPDGTGGLYDHTEAGDAITYSGNVVTAPVATQMLTAAGKVQANVEIYQTGATDKAAVRLATFTFFVNVEKSAYPDAEIISSDYFNILSAEIAAAVGAGAKADQAIQAAEDAEEAATAAGQSAVAAANSATAAGNSANAANTAKTGAEAAKTAAESAKTAAQTAQGSAETAATNAANSANAANTAKTGAETAKAEAEAAKDAAEDAKEAAEAARDEAQTIAGGEYVSYGAAQTLTDEQKSQAKTNIGLGNVDNTSDADKPISTATAKALQRMVNPNLIDNGYFGNPVNQRGQTSYSGNGVYTVDRWITLGANSLITVGDGYMSIAQSTAGGDNARNTQRIAFPENLAGRTVTFSVLTHPTSNSTASSIHILKGTTNFQYNVGSGGVGQNLISVTGTLPTNNVADNMGNRVQISVSSGDFRVLAAKLELGNKQTLAYQDENGNWIPNEIPKYGNTLAECQRYVFPLANDVYYPGRIATGSTTTAFITIPTPVSMRAAPVLSGGAEIAGNWRIYAEGVVKTPTAVSVTRSAAGFVTLNFTITTGIAANTPVIAAYANDTAAGLISADL